MLLIVTNSVDATVDFFQKKLEQVSMSYFRFNTELALTDSTHKFSLGMSSSRMCLIHQGKTLNLDDVTAVWYRRPVSAKIPDEIPSPQAQKYIDGETSYYLKCIWKILEDRKWVSRPWAISWAQTKLAQLRVAKEFGLVIPDTLVTTDPDEATAFYESHRGGIVIKPFAESFFDYGDGRSSTIFTNRVTRKDMQNIHQVRYTPTFFQAYVKKAYEIRVTVFGEDVFVAKTESQKDSKKRVDWRHVSSSPSVWQEVDVPEFIKEQSIAMVKRFGLRFGALDFAVTPKGEYVFFEINPNGQWAWLEIQLGIPMSDSLIKLLT